MTSQNPACAIGGHCRLILSTEYESAIKILITMFLLLSHILSLLPILWHCSMHCSGKFKSFQVFFLGGGGNERLSGWYGAERVTKDQCFQLEQSCILSSQTQGWIATNKIRMCIQRPPWPRCALAAVDDTCSLSTQG